MKRSLTNESFRSYSAAISNYLYLNSPNRKHNMQQSPTLMPNKKCNVESAQRLLPFSSPWETLPRINGRKVEWISDIRKAPGGDYCSFEDYMIIGSEMLIKVHAVASDQFSLYLENGSLVERYPALIGGIYSNFPARKAGAKSSWHVLSFQLPFEKNVKIDLKRSLLPGNECRLADVPKLILTDFKVVKERQNKENHSYFIHAGRILNDTFFLLLEHSFPTTSFRIEYEEKLQKLEDGELKLNIELFAIEDHDNLDCTCVRKGMIKSTIEIDLTKFGFEEHYELNIWGPHDLSISGKTGLSI